MKTARALTANKERRKKNTQFEGRRGANVAAEVKRMGTAAGYQNNNSESGISSFLSRPEMQCVICSRNAASSTLECHEEDNLCCKSIISPGRQESPHHQAHGHYTVFPLMRFTGTQKGPNEKNGPALTRVSRILLLSPECLQVPTNSSDGIRALLSPEKKK